MKRPERNVSECNCIQQGSGRENFMQPWDFQSRPFVAFDESLPTDFRLVNLTVK